MNEQERSEVDRIDRMLQEHRQALEEAAHKDSQVLDKAHQEGRLAAKPDASNGEQGAKDQLDAEQRQKDEQQQKDEQRRQEDRQRDATKAQDQRLQESRQRDERLRQDQQKKDEARKQEAHKQEQARQQAQRKEQARVPEKERPHRQEIQTVGYGDLDRGLHPAEKAALQRSFERDQFIRLERTGQLAKDKAVFERGVEMGTIKPDKIKSYNGFRNAVEGQKRLEAQMQKREQEERVATFKRGVEQGNIDPKKIQSEGDMKDAIARQRMIEAVEAQRRQETQRQQEAGRTQTMGR